MLSLVEYCVDTACRHLLQYEDLPPGLPTELVDRILHSLIMVTPTPLMDPPRATDRTVKHGVISSISERPSWPAIACTSLTPSTLLSPLCLQHRALVKATLGMLRNCEVTSLDLSSCKGVGDDWLPPMADKALIDLNLSGCTSVRHLRKDTGASGVLHS